MNTAHFISQQISWKPDISTLHAHKKTPHFVLCGMGGSHLATGLLKMLRPGIDLYVHRDYNLPPFSDEFFNQSVCIASSYSGNTEEVLSFYSEAQTKGYSLIVITSGGKLLELAKKDNIPFILLPQGLQPRDALGFFLSALTHIVGDQELLALFQSFSEETSPLDIKALSFVEFLQGRIPVIYSSLKNLPLAYIWKIKLNETSKVPAFYNVLPELNHNEMEGFDSVPQTEGLSKQFSFVFLKDSTDNPRIIKRMEVLKELFVSKGLPVLEYVLNTESVLHKITEAVDVAHGVSVKLAELSGVDPESVPLIESFKKKLA
ncbi:MAG: hypothetical protein RJA61_203 [Candidatus Parcubacteria bacterium]|jgi:glucose/mannose-6-phosphate isomerase